jgi:hypothetical protein
MMLLVTTSKLLHSSFPSCHDAAHDVIKAAGGAPPLKYSTISWTSGRPFLLATFVPQMLTGQGNIFSTILENLKYVIYWQNYIICPTINHKEYHKKISAYKLNLSHPNETGHLFFQIIFECANEGNWRFKISC